MFNEDTIEKLCIQLFEQEGYTHLTGVDTNRSSSCDVILPDIFKESICRINNINDSDFNEVYAKIFDFNGLATNEYNNTFSKLLANGGVSILINDESIHVKLIDLENINNNTFNIVDQLTILGAEYTRRPDLIVYINGLPITLIELKNPFNDVDIKDGYYQVNNYLRDIPELFKYTQFNLISDGTTTKVGTHTSDYSRYMYWRSTDDAVDTFDIKSVISSLFNKKKLLNVVANYIMYSENKKVMLGYHQVRAVDNSMKVLKDNKDKKGGIVWHTQGSGKSYTMAFLSNRILNSRNLLRTNATPTIIVVTDRVELDKQLYSTFKKFESLAEYTTRISDGRDLKEKLESSTNGKIYFTNIQKFNESHGLINSRDDLYVITDEAHRSHNNLSGEFDELSGKFKGGNAQYLREALPNATFLGFTGTPISTDEVNTRAVFGEYIDVYDMVQSERDASTVKILYQQIHQDITVNIEEVIKAQQIYDDEVLDLSSEERKKLQSKIVKMDTIIGDDNRIACVVQNMLEHFENKNKILGNKAIFVANSRKIAIKVYNQIDEFRPNMVSNNVSKGQVKVIMSGSASDDENLSKFHTSTAQDELLEKRFKDPDDEFKIAIVVDKWLTGFDAPCIDTIYIDKVMRGHNLMQAIARVNRVYGDKKNGEIVDFIGILPQLEQAVTTYTSYNADSAPIVAKDYDKDIKELIESLAMMTQQVSWRSELSTDNTSLNIILFEKVLSNIKETNQSKEFKSAVSELSNLEAQYGVNLDKKTKLEIVFLKKTSKLLKTLESRREISVEEHVKRIVDQFGEMLSTVQSINVTDIFDMGTKVDLLNPEFLEQLRNKNHTTFNVELLKSMLKTKVNEIKKSNRAKGLEFQDLINNLIKQLHENGITNFALLEELISVSQSIRDYEVSAEGRDMVELSIETILRGNWPKKILASNSSERALAAEIKLLYNDLVSETQWRFNDPVSKRFRSKAKRILTPYYGKSTAQEMITELLEQFKVME